MCEIIDSQREKILMLTEEVKHLEVENGGLRSRYAELKAMYIELARSVNNTLDGISKSLRSKDDGH